MGTGLSPGQLGPGASDTREVGQLGQGQDWPRERSRTLGRRGSQEQAKQLRGKGTGREGQPLRQAGRGTPRWGRRALPDRGGGSWFGERKTEADSGGLQGRRQDLDSHPRHPCLG